MGTWSFEEWRSTRYFPALDGLRGFSVLLVVSFHWPGGQFVDWNGGIGVSLFFVLSGFLITHVLLNDESRRGERADVPAFLLRRTARILPLYMVVLATYCLAVGLGFDEARSDRFWDNLPYFALLAPELALFPQSLDAPFAVAWSIGIEEKFYLVWAILGFALVRGRLAVIRPLLVAAVITVIVIAYPAGTHGHLRYYAHIAMGAAIGLAMHHRRTFPVVARLAAPWVAGIIGFVAFWVAIVQPNGGRPGFLVPISVALLMPSLLAGVGRPARWLSAGWLQWVGRISFSVYLVHQLAFSLSERAVPGAGRSSQFLAGCVGVALTMVVATITFRWFESPINGWARRWSARRGALPSPAKGPGRNVTGGAGGAA